MVGLTCAFLACIFQVSKDSVSKRLAGRLSGLLSAFASFLYPLPLYVLLLAALYFSGLDDLRCSRTLLVAVVLRALADTGTEWCKMTALRRQQLSTVSIIGSMHVVLVVLLSPLITGDPLTTTIVVSAVIASIGTLLYVYNPVDAPRPGALLPAFGFLAFASLNACFDRVASHNGSAPLAAFIMTALSAAFLALPSYRSWPQLRSENQKLLWLRALLETVFMPLKLTVVRYLTAPEAGVLFRLSLVLSFFVGWYFFGEKITARRVTGLILIVAGSTAVIVLR